MKILFLSHRIPYPPNKGDKIRSFHEIKCLSKRHEIDLICLTDTLEELEFRKTLQKYCNKVDVLFRKSISAKMKGMAYLTIGKPISVGYFYHRGLQKRFNERLNNSRYDSILCFSSPMAEYIFRSKFFRLGKIPGTRFKAQKNKQTGNKSPAPALIMDFCDVDSDKWRQYAGQAGFPLDFVYRLEFKHLLRYEKKINATFDQSVFVSQEEADLFARYYPAAKNVRVISNGVDYDYFSPDDVRSTNRSDTASSGALNAHCPVTREAGLSCVKFSTQEKRGGSNRSRHTVLLFTGAMDYHANVDGVIWFHDKVLPLIQEKFSPTFFFIVGSNPTSAVRDLATRNGIKVTGYVDDIRPFYNSADISVIPLRFARGVQNKILEAMAMAKPIVASSKAAEGLKAVTEKHLLIASHAKEFAACVCALIEDPAFREHLGKNARKFVEDNFNWGTNMNQFEELLATAKA